ncbi:MAG: hypothetical protein KatS3mg068_1359 [Candidatus Sericytochromatia bacterium]|nr:MAG: hypothetical protein KatS3mg068_1359 [Candidatus Sericytochromatia bacterium]
MEKDNQDLTIRCPSCNWESNIDDIYCSGCKSYISHIEMFPPNKSYLNIYEGIEELKFILENDGLTDIHLDRIETAFKANNFNSVYLNKKAKKEFNVKFSSATYLEKKKFTIINDKDLDLSYTLELLEKPKIYHEIENISFFNGKYYIPDDTNEINIKVRYSHGIDYVKNVTINDSSLKLDFEKNSEISKNKEFVMKLSLLEGNFTKKFTINIETYSLGNISLEFNTSIYKKTIINRLGRSDSLKLKDSLLVNSGIKTTGVIYEIKNSDIIIDDVSILDNNFIKFSSYLESKEQDENQITLYFDIDTSKLEFEEEDKKISVEYVIRYRQKETNIQDSYKDHLDLSFRKPKTLDGYLVIDFGTSNTCVGWIKKREDGSNEEQLLHFYTYEDDESSQKKYSNPSLLSFESHKEQIFKSDEATYSNVLKDIELFNRTVWGWKKFFGSEKTKLIPDLKGYLESYSIIDLTSLYLRKIIDRFELISGYKAEKFAFTFPAKYIEKRKDLIRAMENMGYKQKNEKGENLIDLYLSEPNALAYYFVASGKYDFLQKENIEIDKPVYFAIFDFGGGTTDITIAKLSKYNDVKEYFDHDLKKTRTRKTQKLKLEIIDSSAPDSFGGDYLDFYIAQFIKDKINDKYNNYNIPFAKDLEELSFSRDEVLINNTAKSLMSEARRIKLQYSESKLDTLINVTVTNLININTSSGEKEIIEPFEIKLEGLDEFLESEIRKGMKYLKDMVNISQIHNPDIDLKYIFLCGNSSKLEVVEKVAKQEFPEPCKVIYSPDDIKEGVVRGALFYYGTEADIDFSINEVLHTSIGYNDNNVFKLFEDQEDDNIKSLRGLKLSQEPIYFDFPEKVYRNLTQEIIYSTELTNVLDDKITIIGNKSVKVSGKIDIPQEARNKPVYIRIYIDNNFPKIKYKIFCDNKPIKEDYLLLNI